MISAVSCVLSAFSVICFIIGCIGFSTDSDPLKSVAWAVYDTDKVYYGLQAVEFNGEIIEYADCNSSVCDDCASDGTTAFGLLIIAVILSLATAAIHGSMISVPNTAMKIPVIVSSLLSFATSIVGVGIFMGGCYVSLEDDTDDGSKLAWGPGSILSIIGMLLMFIVTCLTLWQALGNGYAQAASS